MKILLLLLNWIKGVGQIVDILIWRIKGKAKATLRMYMISHKQPAIEDTQEFVSSWAVFRCVFVFMYSFRQIIVDLIYQQFQTTVYNKYYCHYIFVLVQACLRARHVVADEAKLAIVFTYFFLSFSFSAFYFSPTSGNLPCVKICFPQYCGITRRYMQKKNIFFR